MLGGLFRRRGKHLPTRWGNGDWPAELQAPVCQQWPEKPLCGDVLETLGQESVKCINFSFLMYQISCWLSRHNHITAVNTDPLNISILTTQRPCCSSVCDATMEFPGDPWQTVYLPHLQGGGNMPPHPISGPFASGYTVCIVSATLCSIVRALSQLILQACLEWKWAMIKVFLPGTWCVKLYFTWAITLGYNRNKYSRWPPDAPSWC